MSRPGPQKNERIFRFCLLGFCIAFSAVVPPALAQVSPLAGFYDIRPHKSLAIDYQSKGVLEGTIRVYISGDTAVAILDQYASGQRDSAKARVHWVEIHLPEGVYSYDLTTGTGKSIDNRRWLLKQKLVGLSVADRRYFESYKEKVRAYMVSRAIHADIRPVPVTFLGRKALRYQLPNGTVMTFWNGILMQMELPSSNIHLSAIRMDLNFNAPDSIFNLVRRTPLPRDSLVSAAFRNQTDGLLQAIRSRTLEKFLARSRGGS